MVAPISGPFTKTVTLKGPPTSLGFKPDWIQISRRWYRQKKPYNLPLAFSLDSRAVTSFRDTDPTSYQSVSGVWYGVPQSLVDNTKNAAYAKFVGQTKQINDLSAKGADRESASADLGTNLAEHKQANVMITERLIQLAKFARALRRLRFGDAASALGVSRSQVSKMTLRSSAKSFGNNWLEFHFGWSPLISDIKSSMDVLTSGLPPFRIHASAKRTEVVSDLTQSSTHWKISDTQYTESWRMGALITVTNNNAWLANRLGLVNPLGLAWELVPFSFVADWFVNLNDVIGSMTDFYGLALTNAWNTEFRKVVHSEAESWTGHWSDGTYSGARSRSWSSEYCAVGRSLGIPGPTLRVRPVKALSWQRGLTAASLLLQSIKG